MRNMVFFLTLLILIPSIAKGQEMTASRPKVGVVLSGGGAKGAAHIGVLQYLVEQNIPIDYVVGTSIGSIIGGMYALGYSPDQLSDVISSLDWSYYMSNSVQEDLMSSVQRQQNNLYVMQIPFNLRSASKKLLDDNGSGDGNVSLLGSLPDSFLGGANLTNLFNKMSLGYQDSISFDSLPIPFACIATDIVSGKGVVMRSGCLPLAIRASMALPGIFTPVRMNNMVLMDGGFANNFPTDVCRQMGADIIIGVEVSDDLEPDADKLRSLPQLAGQLLSLSMMNKKDANRELCDVYIRPNVSEYGSMSFYHEALDVMIRRGYDEAKRNTRQIDSLKALLQGGECCRLNAAKAKHLGDDTIYISKIIFDGVDSVERKWLLYNSKLREMSLTTGSVIDRSIDIFKGTGAYSQITYNLYPETYQFRNYDSYRLVVRFDHAEPHAFGLGLRYDTEESTALLLSVGFNQNRIAAPKLQLSTRLNYNPRISAGFSYEGLRFGAVHVDYELAHNNYSSEYNGDLLCTVKQMRQVVNIYWSQLYSRFADVRIGVTNGWSSMEQFIATNTLVGLDNPKPYTGFFARWNFDSRDRVCLANRGWKADGHFVLRVPRDKNTLRCDGRMFGAFQFSLAYSHVLGDSYFVATPQLYACVTAGGDNLIDQHTVFGGLIQNRYADFHLPFAGMTGVDFYFDDAAVVRYDLRYNHYKNHYITLISNAIVGSKCDLLSFSNASSDYAVVGGFAVQYSVLTKVGPMSLDLNWNTISHRWGGYLSLGYEF